jgi:hypothetical protein
MTDMKGRSIYVYILSVGVASASCKKPYTPEIISGTNSLLVVEGVINPGNDSTFITLSHTVKISDTVKTAAERGATVAVESGSARRPLTEISPGVYSALPLNLDTTQQYRLRIKLSNGKEYVSDFEKPKITPPIDTVTYTIKDTSLQINLSAHDPSNSTRYYRWDYSEAWRFNSKFYSSYKVVNGTIYPRLPAEDIFSCFSGAKSSSIVLGSSVKLAQDVISKALITTIISGSEKISVRYSILVKQYALTKQAFAFYENVKKNTEQLGSIFDALPSEVGGNIHNTANLAEPVIGYVGVSTVQSKRIFIDKEELPATWITQYPYNCTQDTALFNNPKTKLNEVKAFILTNITLPTLTLRAKAPDTTLLGYYRTDFICGDCTLRGTKKRPAFWKDK